MTKQPTPRRALEETIQLWTAIAEDGYRDKRRAADAHPELNHMRGYLHVCPCCEFTTPDDSFPDCRLCPAWDCTAPLEYRCTVDSATYCGWTRATDPDEAKHFALALVALAKRKLAELSE